MDPYRVSPIPPYPSLHRPRLPVAFVAPRAASLEDAAPRLSAAAAALLSESRRRFEERGTSAMAAPGRPSQDFADTAAARMASHTSSTLMAASTTRRKAPEPAPAWWAPTTLADDVPPAAAADRARPILSAQPGAAAAAAALLRREARLDGDVDDEEGLDGTEADGSPATDFSVLAAAVARAELGGMHASASASVGRGASASAAELEARAALLEAEMAATAARVSDLRASHQSGSGYNGASSAPLVSLQNMPKYQHPAGTLASEQPIGGTRLSEGGILGAVFGSGVIHSSAHADLSSAQRAAAAAEREALIAASLAEDRARTAAAAAHAATVREARAKEASRRAELLATPRPGSDLFFRLEQAASRARVDAVTIEQAAARTASELAAFEAKAAARLAAVPPAAAAPIRSLLSLVTVGAHAVAKAAKSNAAVLAANGVAADSACQYQEVYEYAPKEAGAGVRSGAVQRSLSGMPGSRDALDRR